MSRTDRNSALCVDDILLNVLQSSSRPTLSACALVNWRYNLFASKLLYTHVVLSPPPPTRGVLHLRAGRDGLSKPNQFTSSILPRHVHHVLTLEISGYISALPPPLNKLAVRIREAILCYPNLRTLTLAPTTFHPNLFGPILPQLIGCPNLCELTVNSSCTGEENIQSLVALEQLTKLTIIDPTRAILIHLPGWLSNLPSLLELRLRANCGSVSNGVLMKMLPHVRNVRSFSIGLSYSLTDWDVFTFLSALPQLREVEVQYYIQLASPKTFPPLKALRSFVAIHPVLTTRSSVNHFTAWVRRAIRSSPLESLRLVCEDREDFLSGPSIAFDSLASSIASRHASTLKVLDLGGAFLGLSALAQICRSCRVLEIFRVAVGLQDLSRFLELLHVPPSLHTIALAVRNAKRGRVVFGTEDAETVMKRSPGLCLRRVSVDGKRWEGRWVSDPVGGVVSFVVDQVEDWDVPGLLS